MRDCNSGRHFTSFPKGPDRQGGPPTVLFNGSSFTYYRARGVRLTSHIHLLLNFGMCGAIHPFFLHAVMTSIGTILPIGNVHYTLYKKASDKEYIYFLVV
jgi:hypothetical protein